MPGVTFKLKKKPPDPERLFDRVAGDVEKVARDIGRQHVEQRGKVIETWQAEVPEWYFEVTRRSGPVVRLEVFMSGDAFGQNKWRWLDKGTKVRRAVMTRDFKAKTRPRIISSSAGQGGKAFVGKKLKLPGIDERLFDQTINERLTKRYNGRIETTLKRSIKRKRV